MILLILETARAGERLFLPSLPGLVSTDNTLGAHASVRQSFIRSCPEPWLRVVRLVVNDADDQVGMAQVVTAAAAMMRCGGWCPLPRRGVGGLSAPLSVAAASRRSCSAEPLLPVDDMEVRELGEQFHLRISSCVLRLLWMRTRTCSCTGFWHVCSIQGGTGRNSGMCNVPRGGGSSCSQVGAMSLAPCSVVVGSQIALPWSPSAGHYATRSIPSRTFRTGPFSAKQLFAGATLAGLKTKRAGRGLGAVSPVPVRHQCREKYSAHPFHGAASKVLRRAITVMTCPHELVSLNPLDLPCACDSIVRTCEFYIYIYIFNLRVFIQG